MLKFNNESDSEQEQLNSILVIIQRHLVQKSQIQIDHVICSICHNILWKPILCGAQTGCHNSFCSTCIADWILNLKQKQLKPTCPNCKSQFISSVPHPILKSILNNLIIHCQNTVNGCKHSTFYNQIQTHLKECQYFLTRCPGCKKQVLKKDYEDHTNICQQYIIQCQKCKKQMSKRHYLKNHLNLSPQNQNKKIKQQNSSLQLDKSTRSTQCFQFEINSYDQTLENLESKLQRLYLQFNRVQTISNNFISLRPIDLKLTFYTSFSQHFTFTYPQQKKTNFSLILKDQSLSQPQFLESASILVTLSKASYNLQKQKNDFLHFYISSPIYLSNCIAIIKWRIKLRKMSGNILIGFCNSMAITSLDYIINKYGELKRKSQTQNRYKIIKKYEGFSFGQGNILNFEYLSKKKQFSNQSNFSRQKSSINNNIHLRIFNQTRNCQVILSQQQMIQQFLGKQKLYAFYSMDTLNDCIQFLERKNQQQQ